MAHHPELTGHIPAGNDKMAIWGADALPGNETRKERGARCMLSVIGFDDMY